MQYFYLLYKMFRQNYLLTGLEQGLRNCQRLLRLRQLTFTLCISQFIHELIVCRLTYE